MHAGALLALRALIKGQGVTIVDERSGERIVNFGMINARRIAPFTRHIMVERNGFRVLPGLGRSGKPRVAFDEAAMPRPPSQGGALHQLVYMSTTGGRELLLDFTGPQYGVDDALEATGTPCWRCEVGEEGRAGYELQGSVAPFSEPQIHPGILDNQMHAMIAGWVRDSALGVLAHRHATGSPLVAARPSP